MLDEEHLSLLIKLFELDMFCGHTGLNVIASAYSWSYKKPSS